MLLDIVLWLRDMDTYRGSNWENWHLCKDMLGIKQLRDHVTNERLYLRVYQVPISQMILEHQFKFKGHCFRMPTHEPINRFVFFESKVRPSLRPGAQTSPYRQHILSYLIPDEKATEAEKLKIAVNKSGCNKHFVVSKKKKPPDLSS